MGEEQKVGYEELLEASRTSFDEGTDFTLAVEEEFALLDPAAPALTFKATDITAGALESLGFTAASGQQTGPGTRIVAGTELDVADNQDRFFIKTDNGATGLTVSLGIGATDLAFNTSFGPIAVAISGGHATLGADADQAGRPHGFRS